MKTVDFSYGVDVLALNVRESEVLLTVEVDDKADPGPVSVSVSREEADQIDLAEDFVILPPPDDGSGDEPCDCP